MSKKYISEKYIFFGKNKDGAPSAEIKRKKMLFSDLFALVEAGITSTKTHQQFLSLGDDEQKAFKSTNYFLAATFKLKNHKSDIAYRNNENIEYCHLIALDIDNNIDNKNLLEMLSTTGVPPELKHLNMFYYATTSSRDDSLRGRLVIDVKPFEQKFHQNIVSNIVDILNIQDIDKVSQNPSQPMYFPLIFSDYASFSRMYTSEAPTGVVRKFLEYEGKTPPDSTQQRSAALRDPPNSYSDDTILEAINSLPVDFDDNHRYEPRFRIAAALKHQYQNDISKGREMIEAYAGRWTSPGSKEKILRIYDTVKTTLTDRPPITIGTLIHDATENEWVPSHNWLADYIMLRQNDKKPYYNIKYNESWSKTAFDNEYNILFINSENPWLKSRDGLASGYATKVRGLKSYADKTFFPGEKKILNFEKGGPEYYNTYVPIEDRHPPNYSAAKKTIKIMEKHIADIVCDPKLERLVMSFLANIAQNPSAPAVWALVIISKQGTGKTLMWLWLKAILGKHAEDPRWVDYTSNQSDYLEDTQLLLLNEVLPGRRNAVCLTESLKTIIDGKKAKLKKFYYATKDVPSRMNIMLFSNKKEIITPEDDRRRYLYIDSPITPEEAEAKYNAGGFKEAVNLAQHPCDIVAALLKYKIDKNFDIYKAYQTEAIEKLRQDTQSNEAQIIQELIDSDEYHGVGVHIISLSHLSKAGHDIKPNELRSALQEIGYCKRRCIDRDLNTDNRLCLPSIEGKPRPKLVTYVNRNSTEKQIKEAEEELKKQYVSEGSFESLFK